MTELTGPAFTIQLVRDRLARRRAAEGISLRGLGGLVGMSASAIKRFEGGEQPAADHFLALAEWAGFALVGKKDIP